MTSAKTVECHGCKHQREEVDGFCYMFVDKPAVVPCQQHDHSSTEMSPFAIDMKAIELKVAKTMGFPPGCQVKPLQEIEVIMNEKVKKPVMTMLSFEVPKALHEALTKEAKHNKMKRSRYCRMIVSNSKLRELNNE